MRRIKRIQTDFPEPKVTTNLLICIILYSKDVFPNFRIDLQILLTIGIYIVSFERSFKQTEINSYLNDTRVA